MKAGKEVLPPPSFRGEGGGPVQARNNNHDDDYYDYGLLGRYAKKTTKSHWNVDLVHEIRNVLAISHSH